MTPDLWDAGHRRPPDRRLQRHPGGLAPLLREQAYGRIVSTSSAAGIFGNFGQANYGAAKMGIVGLTRVWAQEGGKYNIRANAIAPVARTRMTEDLLGPLVEKIDPELVSPVVAYLASEDCQVTGEIYSVGGGRVAAHLHRRGPGLLQEGPDHRGRPRQLGRHPRRGRLRHPRPA